MVGEAAFLRRSFSHPSSASREAKEGDPACALTESISFGRFMSESLAWEKWSTFTHNRYLEEIEQFSKPGSVAQKKAFFEAHYKKRAAMKAAALPEQATATVSNVPQTIKVDETHQESSPEAAVPVATGGIVTDQQQENGALNTSLDHSANANASYHIARVDKSKTAQEKSNTEVIEQNVEVESQTMMENVKHVENSEDRKKLATIPEEKMPEKEAAQQENMDLPSNKRQMSSSKLTSQAKVLKLPNSSAKQAGQLKDRKSVLSSSNNSAGDLIYMKRSTQKSIHMSINFASHSGEANKSTLRMFKESAMASRDPARASVYGVSKLLSSIVCHSENNSRLKSSSGSGSKAKSVISSLKAEESSLKSSSVSGSNVRSSVISCPFSFKSEERAAKRKEFFQKLKERNRAKAEKHILEEREDHPVLNRPQLRTSFRTKFENPDQVSNSRSNHIKKMPATRPHSPERGGKPIPSIIQEKSSQLPRRPPVNTGSSKDILSKSNQSTTRSVTMLQKKKARENASPNIHR